MYTAIAVFFFFYVLVFFCTVLGALTFFPLTNLQVIFQWCSISLKLLRPLNELHQAPSHPITCPPHVLMIETATAWLSSSSGPGAVASVLHVVSLSLTTTYVIKMISGWAGVGHSSVYSKTRAPDCTLTSSQLLWETSVFRIVFAGDT